MAEVGFSLEDILDKGNFIIPIVHAHCDLYHPLRTGDQLNIQLNIEKISDSSFTIVYKINKKDITAAQVRTVHVLRQKRTNQKIEIPLELKKNLIKYKINN